MQDEESEKGDEGDEGENRTAQDRQVSPHRLLPQFFSIT